MIKADKIPSNRVCQGDVVRNVDYVEAIVEHDGVLELTKIRFPLIIVLTQDCDLEQDYSIRSEGPPTQDRKLISVLVAPLYNADHVFAGEHLSDLQIASELISKNKTPGDYLVKNQRPRYHYLDFPPEIDIVPSVIDFKHYFSVNVTYLEALKATDFVCTVSQLYREDVSQRFAAFLSRIGLPSLVQASNHSLNTDA